MAIPSLQVSDHFGRHLGDEMSIITDGENDVLDTPDPTIPTVASTDADMPWLDPEDRWPQDDDGVVWVREVSCPSPAAADRFHEARRQLRACHDQIVAAEREVERRQAHLVRLRADLVAFDQYTPPAALRRAIQARDQTCRFPGCTHPAAGCETDHTIGYRITRRTGYDDLASLCASHHQLKHILGRDEGWYVEQVSPGILEWTSPHGRRFVRYPEPQPTAIIRKEEGMPF